jgi:hypothetical protein
MGGDAGGGGDDTSLVFVSAAGEHVTLRQCDGVGDAACTPQSTCAGEGAVQVTPGILPSGSHHQWKGGLCARVLGAQAADITSRSCGQGICVTCVASSLPWCSFSIVDCLRVPPAGWSDRRTRGGQEAGGAVASPPAEQVQHSRGNFYKGAVLVQLPCA